MPRTKGAATIRAWRMEQLIRDLAIGDRTAAELAEAHGVEEQTVWVFTQKHRDEITAVCQDWAGKLDHIWSVRKANRIRVLTERFEFLQVLIGGLIDEARRATEAMRNIDPDAAEVLVNTKDFNAFHDRQVRILRDIAEETGQLPTRVQPEAAAKPHLYHSVLGVDLQKALGTATDQPAAAESAPAVEPSVDHRSEAEPMRGELFRANPPLPVPEPEPAVEVPVEPPVAPAQPVLPDETVRAARAIAIQVWSTGTKPQAHLFEGKNEVGQAEASAALSHAVGERWVAISGDQLVKGSVSPHPMEALPDERNSRSWGPSRD